MAQLGRALLALPLLAAALVAADFSLAPVPPAAAQNVDTAGTVTITNGDPPVAGTALTASLSDSDGGVTNLTWQWSRSTTSSGTFSDIPTATNASYTPTGGEAGYFLKATASYDDTNNTGRTASAVTAQAVGAVSRETVLVSNVDQSAGSDYEIANTMNDAVAAGFKTPAGSDDFVVSSVELPLSVGAGAEIVVRIRKNSLTTRFTAPSRSNAPVATLSNPSSFDADTATLEVFTHEGATLEPNSYYWVTVERTNASGASDAAVSIATANTDSIDVLSPESGFTLFRGRARRVGSFTWQGTADAVDEPKLRISGLGTGAPDQAGSVRFLDVPKVGSALGAVVDDADGGVSNTTWQWSRSTTANGSFTDITNATGPAYTPTAADENYFLKATATYDDNHGLQKTASAVATDAVKTVSVTPSPVLLSNVGRNPGTDVTATNMAYAQQFITADQLGGFVLDSVEVGLSAASTLTAKVSILTDDNGSPGTSVGELTAPSSIDTDTDTTEVFTAPDIELDAATPYWVEVSFTGSGARGLSTIDIDDTRLRDATQPGWAMGGSLWFNDGAWKNGKDAAATNAFLEIGVRGTELPSRLPPYVNNRRNQPPAAVAKTSATQPKLAMWFTAAQTRHLSLVDSVVLSVAADPGTEVRVAIHPGTSTNPSGSPVAGGVFTTPLGISTDLDRPQRAVFTLPEPLSMQGGFEDHYLVVDAGSGSGRVSVATTAANDYGSLIPEPVEVIRILGWDLASQMRVFDGSDWAADGDGRSFRMAVDGPSKFYVGVPQVGVEISSPLRYLGLVEPMVLWQWQRGASQTGPFADIPRATSFVYTPTESDEGQWLRLVTGHIGDRGEQTVEGVVSLTEVLSKPSASTTRAPFHPELGSTDFGLDYTLGAEEDDRSDIAPAFMTGPNPSGYLLRGVRFRMSTHRDEDDSHREGATWTLYADDGDKPAAAPLFAPIPVDFPDLGPSTQMVVDMAHPQGWRLEPNTKYWVSLTDPGNGAWSDLEFSILSTFGEHFVDDTTPVPHDPVTEDGWSLDFDALSWSDEGDAGNFRWVPFLRPMELPYGPGFKSVPRWAVVAEEATWPSTVRGLTANPLDGGAELYWSEPASVGQSPIARYEYRYKVGSGAFGAWTAVPGTGNYGNNSDPGIERTVEITGLTNGTEHTFEVRAVNTGDHNTGEATSVMATPSASSAGVTIVPDKDKYLGKADRIVYTLTRPLSSTGDKTVQVTLLPPSGNDWAIPDDKLVHDVTFTGNNSTATFAVSLQPTGPESVGFSADATVGGTLVAAVSGDGVEGHARSVTVVVVPDPAWVVRFDEPAYEFAENAGSGTVKAVMTATHPDVPPPTNDMNGHSVLGISLSTEDGTALEVDNDYGPIAGQLWRPAASDFSLVGGVQRAEFDVQISVTDDSSVESPREHFLLNLTPLAGTVSTAVRTVEDTDGSRGDSAQVRIDILDNEADHPGVVSFDGLPGVGVALTATLSDFNGGLSGQSWQWSRSRNESGPFDTISTATAASYTPTEGDRGHYLRAAVSYTDSTGSGKSATGVTGAAVGDRVLVSNVAQTAAPARATFRDNPAYAQPFTTGSFAGGYQVSSVALGLGVHVDASARLKILGPITEAGLQAASTPRVDLAPEVARLVPLGDVDDDASTVERFSADGRARLLPNSTYWVEVRRFGSQWDGVSVATTASDAEDAGAETGFSIGNNIWEYESGGWSDPSRYPSNPVDLNMRIEVQGRPALVVIGSADDPVVGTALTATLADGSDSDNTNQVWQWSRSATASGEFTAITSADNGAGTNTSTYTPVAGDEGYYLRVTVTYDDGTDSGVSASDLTEVTVAKAGGGTSPGRVRIAGGVAPELGTELSAALSDSDVPLSAQRWQWSRGYSAGGEFTNISGADNGTNSSRSTYTPTSADEGRFLRATVTYTDSTGSGKTASATTTAKLPGFDPLVSNVDKTAGADIVTSARRVCFAQEITVGPNRGGYLLDSVELGASVAAGVTVEATLRLTSSLFDGEPAGNQSANRTYALLANPTFDTDTSSLELFPATPVVMYPGLSHWVTICNTSGDDAGLSLATTADDGNDPGGAAGFEIGDNVRVYRLADPGDPNDFDDWFDYSSNSEFGASKVERNMKLRLNGRALAPAYANSHFTGALSTVETPSTSHSARASSFTTGSQRGGYEFDGLVLATNGEDAGDIVVTVRADRLGEPASTALWTLENPREIVADAASLFPVLGLFKAPPGAVLERDTTFWVVVEASGARSFVVGFDRSEETSPGQAPGFEIAKTGRRLVTATSSWEDAVRSGIPEPLWMAVLGRTEVDAQAEEGVWASNFAERDSGYIRPLRLSQESAMAASFTTGFEPDGYELGGVRLSVGGPATTRVAVHADSSGVPGASLWTLEPPVGGIRDEFPSRSGAGSVFQAPDAGATLAADTTYWVVVDDSTDPNHSGAVAVSTASDAQKVQPGWSLGDAARYYSTASSSWESADPERARAPKTLRMEVLSPEGTTKTLVTNKSQTAGSVATLGLTKGHGQATAFFTGRHPGGYLVSSVALGISAGSDATVEVEILDDGSSKPGSTVVGTLTGTADDDTSTYDEFTSTTEVLLEPATWYWAAVRRTSETGTGTSHAVTLATANTNDIDTSDSVAGFDMGGGRSAYTTSWAHQSSGPDELKIIVKGIDGPAAPVLVANTGASSGGDVSTASGQSAIAQRFTTGSSPGGYLLESAQAGVKVDSGVVEKVYLIADDNGKPDQPGTIPRLLTTLNRVGRVDNSTTTLETYRAAADGYWLAPATSYWLAVFRESGADAGVSVATTSSNAEDAGGSTGFEIGDNAWNNAGGSWSDWSTLTPAVNRNMKLSLRGTSHDGVTPPAAFDATGGNARVLLEWEAPVHDGGSPVDYYQIRAKTRTGEWSSWATIADSDDPGMSRADERRTVLEQNNLISLTGVTSSAVNGTSFSFEIRAVNTAGDQGLARGDSAVTADEPKLTVSVDNPVAIGKVDAMTYTVTRTGATTNKVDITLELVPFEGNDWGLNPDKMTFDVEIAAGQTTGTSEIRHLIDTGFRGIGFDDSATMSGIMEVRADESGYDLIDAVAEIDVRVFESPLFVITLEEESYEFAEGGGPYNVRAKFTSQHKDMPEPQLAGVYQISFQSESGTAVNPDDFNALSIQRPSPSNPFTKNSEGFWEGYQSTPLTVHDDSVAEPTETLSLHLRSAPGFQQTGAVVFGRYDEQGMLVTSTSGGSDFSVPATIVDNDPGVIEVTVASSPALKSAGQATFDTYGRTETIQIAAQFNKDVTVTGTPTFPIAVGSNTRTASYDASSSDADTVVFSYTVVQADADTDGISWAEDALSVPTNASIKAAGTNTDALVVHPAQDALTGHKVDGSQVAITSPTFDATLIRPIAENSSGGTAVGAPAAADDPDGDTLYYQVSASSGTAAAAATLAAFNRHFDFNTSTAQITVKSGASIDFETRSLYVVLLEVTDCEDSTGTSEGASYSACNRDASVLLRVEVSNVDEPGTVEVSGNPNVGGTLTATVTDEDGAPSQVTWKWQRASTQNGAYADISGEVNATYTPVAADIGKWLRAVASYTDPQGSGKSDESDPIGPVVAHSMPTFSDGATATRQIAEDVTGSSIRARIVASDADGDQVHHWLVATGDADGAEELAAFMRDFTLLPSSGGIRLRPDVSLDHETKASYKVKVNATDCEDASGINEGHASFTDCTIDDSTVLTVEVTNVDEVGTVRALGTAAVGVTLRGEVSDPDGSVSVSGWQWSKSSQATGPFTDLPGETGEQYLVVLADQGAYLRVTADYSDGHGSGKSGHGTTDGPVRQVTRTNAEPEFSAASASADVSEAASAGTRVGTFRATDGDNDTLHCSVADDDTDGVDDLAAFNRNFAYDCATGVLSVRAEAQLDYETKTSYRVILEVSDRENIIDQADTIIDDELSLRIDVTNADDPGSVSIDGDAAVGLALAAVLTDPDGAPTEVSWQWSVSDAQAGPFTDITGADEALYLPAAADEDRWLRATASYTDPQGAGKTASATSATAVAAVPPPPEDRALWRRVSFTRDRDTAYYSLAGWNPETVRVEEGGGAATVWVRLDRAQVVRPYSVPVTVVHGGGASESDYRISPAVVSFQPEAAFASFTVEAVGDGVDDDNEYLILGLDVPDGLRAGHVTTLRVDLVDDPEDIPPARLSFDAASVSADEGEWVTATVTLGAPPDESIQNWSVLARLEVSSTLENGEGVHVARADRTQLRFSSGKMTDTVRVLCGSDRVDGPDHTVTVRLGEVTAGSRSGGPTHTLELETGAGINHELVVDCADANEPADLWARMTVAGSGPWYRPSESGAAAVVVVSLSDPADREVTIPIETVHHGALTADDYSGVPDEVTFAVGQQTASFEIWATDDDIDDDGEWLEVKFGALPARVAVAGGRTYHSAADAYWDRSRYAIEIIDDDDTPVAATSGTTSASVSFIDTAQAVEPGAMVTVTVELNRLRPFGGTRVQKQVTVPLGYSYGGGATATDWGSGVRGADELPTDLVFEPGQRYHKFRIVAAGSHTPDSPKTITVTFGTLPEGVTAYSDDDHHDTITITFDADS